MESLSLRLFVTAPSIHADQLVLIELAQLVHSGAVQGTQDLARLAMTTVTLEKAQQDLPVLVKRALAGEEIVIEASQAAAVRLAPIAPAPDQPVPPGASYRGRGALKGQLVVGPEFFEPLTDEECGVGGEPGAA